MQESDSSQETYSSPIESTNPKLFTYVPLEFTCAYLDIEVLKVSIPLQEGEESTILSNHDLLSQYLQRIFFKLRNRMNSHYQGCYFFHPQWGFYKSTHKMKAYVYAKCFATKDNLPEIVNRYHETKEKKANEQETPT